MSGRASYWIAAADGTVQAFGGAPALGSGRWLGGAPIVGIASPVHGGYWLAAADGRTFAFGEVPDDGRLLPRPPQVIGIAAAR